MAENQPPSQSSHQVAKTTIVIVGGSLMVFSTLIAAATTVLLTVATPLLVIFSPVLVPAYATGKHPIGSEKIDRASARIGEVTKEMKEKAQHPGQQQTRGRQGL
ncbi:unnamed protein product [Ilex paraguariensis]|uniref:Oleosin n=1 Tax=Ilex paraguariensis TaxID=185542 RepID=A0ABC8RV48_9AQUA